MPAALNLSNSGWFIGNFTSARGSTTKRTGTPAFARAIISSASCGISIMYISTSIPVVSARMRSSIGQRQFSNDGSHRRSCAEAAHGATTAKEIANEKMTASRIRDFMVYGCKRGEFMQPQCENLFDTISKPSRLPTCRGAKNDEDSKIQ